jgi:hypothetical protein
VQSVIKCSSKRPNFIWNKNDPKHQLIAGGVNDEGVCNAPS